MAADRSKPVLPTTQRAVVGSTGGQPKLIDSLPIPELLPNTILVRTAAVALNPYDHKIGTKCPSSGAIIGNDFAGSVVALDPDTTSELVVGETVCGTVHGSNPDDSGNGSFAQYVRVPANLVLRVPAHLRLDQAAAVGLSLATNCLALWESVLALSCSPDYPAREPLSILVYGASTATGTMALQLLRLSGLDPIATCSPRNFDLVRSYGASAVFDYTEPEVADRIKKHTQGRLRYALDCIADGDSVACCYASIARTGGQYVCLERCAEELKTRRAVKAEFVIALEIFGKKLHLGDGYERPANKEKHEAAVRWFRMFQRLLDEGKLRAHPTQVLQGGLDAVPAGLRLLREGKVSGKKLVALVDS